MANGMGRILGDASEPVSFSKETHGMYPILDHLSSLSWYLRVGFTGPLWARCMGLFDPIASILLLKMPTLVLVSSCMWLCVKTAVAPRFTRLSGLSWGCCLTKSEDH